MTEEAVPKREIGQGIWPAVRESYRACAKKLILADVCYKFIAFILLTPLLSILLRTLLVWSGKSVLVDQDLLFFVLGPLGWCCAILIGGIWLTISALEFTTLVAILAAHAQHQEVSVRAALYFCWKHSLPVLRLALRVVGALLFTTLPILALAALTYYFFLTDYDINYYLKEWPPVFQRTLAVGVLLLAILFAIWMRLVSGWFFALPILVLERATPTQALLTSQRRARGQRLRLLRWIVGWIIATIVLSTLVSLAVTSLATFFLPWYPHSVSWIAFILATFLLLSFIAGQLVQVFSATGFAAAAVQLYRCHGRGEHAWPPPHLHIDSQQRDWSHLVFTPGRVLIVGGVSLAISLLLAITTLRTIRLQDEVVIIAHRGGAKEAPENSVAAIQMAIDCHADWIEIDVQETADGEVVVYHDSDFMRLAKTKLNIWDARRADLDQIDIGSWFNPQFAAERVPTLDEVLARCRGKVKVTIELKYYGHDEQLEQRVIDLVQQHQMVDEVQFMSLKVEAVKKMKDLQPEWRTGLLMSVTAGNLTAVPADFLAVSGRFADRRFIQQAHGQGRDVYVWTINDAQTMSRMISRGVDGLITDDPALARSVLEQRAALSSPERLLLDLAEFFGIQAEPAEQ